MVLIFSISKKDEKLNSTLTCVGNRWIMWVTVFSWLIRKCTFFTSESSISSIVHNLLFVLLCSKQEYKWRMWAHSFPFRFSLCKYLDEFSSLHIMVYVREIYAVSRGAWISRNRFLGRLFASEERPRLWFLNLFNTVFLLAFFLALWILRSKGYLIGSVSCSYL